MATMPFGKHAGEDVADLPDSYLEWLVRAQICRTEWLSQAVALEWSKRCRQKAGGAPRQQAHEERMTAGNALEVLGQWYRRASLQYHPDRGGSTLAMQVVNEAYATLKEALCRIK